MRFTVFSAVAAPAPKVLRSAGISVPLIQLPFAKPKKSSPGATLRSMPRIDAGRRGGGRHVTGAGVGAGAGAGRFTCGGGGGEQAAVQGGGRA